MEHAQNRLLIVLSALVFAVGGALYLQGEETAPVDPEATSAVWEIAEDAVTALEVERESGPLRLEKVDGGWFVREPFDARADEDQVRDLIQAVTEIRAGIPVGPVSDPAEFGLGSTPHARVTVTLADDTSRTLEVGIAAPIGFRTYVRAADGGVVAANGDANRPLQADAQRYRDRRIFRFDPAEVREVSIASPEGTLRVNGQGKDWWLEGFSHADPNRVDDLVVGLLDLRFDTVREGIVVEPRIRVEVLLSDGERLSLEVGDPSAPEVLARTTDGRGGTLWPEATRELGWGPSDLGWRTAFGIRMDEADAVSLTVGDRTVEAHRSGSAWTAEGFDEGAVYDALLSLSRVPIEYRLEPPPAPASAEYTITVVEGDRRWIVLVGPPIEDGFRAARDPAGGEAYRIPADGLVPVVEALGPHPR